MTQQTANAETVLGIVREVLDRPAVQLDDDLYDLGFTSLQIMRTAARVTERTGIELPLTEYFDAATVAELAAAVDRHG
jgi:acyl carrier protein